MQKFLMVLTAALILSMSHVSISKAEAIKAGKWSMTMNTKMEGMEDEMADMAKEMEAMSPEEKAMMQGMMGSMGMKMDMGAGAGGGMDMTVEHCVTADDYVPQEPDKDCSETHEIKGNTVHFTSVCTGKKSKTESKGHMKYTGDSMKGHIDSVETVGRKTTNSSIDISGKYLGPCS